MKTLTTLRNALALVCLLPLSLAYAGTPLSLKVYLQGAYTGSAHHTLLNTSGILNAQFRNGGESTEQLPAGASVAANVVDRVEVEFMVANAPNKVVLSLDAFVLTDGRVVQFAGENQTLDVNLPNGSYYIMVRHRNHLPLLSAQPVTLSGEAVSLDLTQAANVSKGSARVTKNGALLMVAGEVNRDDAMEINVLDLYLATNAKEANLKGYQPADVNLDGKVDSADLELVQQANDNLYRTVLQP